MIRARFSNGVLEPLEPLDLTEGAEVLIDIDREPSAEDEEASRSAAGGWKDAVDCDKLIRDIYESRLVSTRPIPQL